MFLIDRKITLLIALAVLIPVKTLFAAPEMLKLELQQAIDTDCNGIIEGEFSATAKQMIAPDECIVYRIMTKNISSQTLSDIVISGKIPPYTQYVKNSLSLQKNGNQSTKPIIGTINSAIINSRALTLKAQETIELYYSVKVD